MFVINGSQGKEFGRDPFRGIKGPGESVNLETFQILKGAGIQVLDRNGPEEKNPGGTGERAQVADGPGNDKIGRDGSGLFPAGADRRAPFDAGRVYTWPKGRNGVEKAVPILVVR